MSNDATVLPGQKLKDRGTRLLVFGVLSLLAGGVWFLFGLLSLLLPFLATAGLGAVSMDLRSAVMSFVLDAMLGAAFVVTGVGSLRHRRWTPSMMLILAWAWLIGGVVALALVPGLVDGMLDSPAAGLGSVATGVGAMVKGFVVLVVAVGGVALPAAFVWAYRDQDLRLTCERDDPAPAWTERCPTPVLGLSVGMAAFAAMGIPMLLRPVVPCFGLLLEGWAGLLAIVAGGVASAWLARETFRRTAAGWWGSTLLLTLFGASTVVTLLRVDPAELYRKLGYSDEQLELLSGGVDGPLLAWLTALMTVATVVYMVAIRRHFAPRSPSG